HSLEETRHMSEATEGPVLRVQGLSVAMVGNGVPVVDDVSFDLNPGQLLGLVGESGSGKSTVALALLGFTRLGLKISGGSVNLDGDEVLESSGRALRRLRGKTVSYVPQDPGTALSPTMRVGAQLAEAIKVHGGVLPSGESVGARVAQLLDEVNL